MLRLLLPPSLPSRRAVQLRVHCTLKVRKSARMSGGCAASKQSSAYKCFRGPGLPSQGIHARGMPVSRPELQGAYFEQMLLLPNVLGEFRSERKGSGGTPRSQRFWLGPRRVFQLAGMRM